MCVSLPHCLSLVDSGVRSAGTERVCPARIINGEVYISDIQACTFLLPADLAQVGGRTWAALGSLLGSFHGTCLTRLLFEWPNDGGARYVLGKMELLYSVPAYRT